jgi:hypothetical protein
MIAFGCAITEPEHYKRHAEPGIRLAAESDSRVFAQAAPRSVAPIYNLLLDEAAMCRDLEFLVLLDEEAQIIDTEFCRKLRVAFSDPDVAIVGCAGAVGVASIAWWEGSSAWASSVHRSRELDGEEFPGLAPDGWGSGTPAPDAGPGEVDAVDGVLMALSPWAVRNVRFDESLGPRYGYDFDYCMQVRTEARKVLTTDLAVAHFYPLGVVEDPDTWIEAHIRAAEKWDGRMPGGPGPESDWKVRARRAEGEAAAARLLSASKMYEVQALTWANDRQFEQATDSVSWKVTAPLRRINAARRARATTDTPRD